MLIYSILYNYRINFHFKKLWIISFVKGVLLKRFQVNTWTFYLFFPKSNTRNYNFRSIFGQTASRQWKHQFFHQKLILIENKDINLNSFCFDEKIVNSSTS